MKKLLAQIKANPLFIKYELYLAPVGAGVALLLLGLLVVFPNIFQYFENQKKIDDTTDKITFFQQKAKTLQAINQGDFKEALRQSLIVLPPDKEAPAAIAQLYYILGQTGINAENISFSEGSNPEGRSFRISMEISGSLSSLTNFIIKLKESPRIIRIESLEVGTQGNTGEIFSSIILNAYYEPLPASAVAIDKPVSMPSQKEIDLLSKLQTTSFPIFAEDTDYSGVKGRDNPFQ